MLPESALTSMNVLFATPRYISNVMMNYVVSITANGAVATASGVSANANGTFAGDGQFLNRQRR